MSQLHPLAFINPDPTGAAFALHLHPAVARNHSATVLPEIHAALCSAMAAFRTNPFLDALHVAARFDCPELEDGLADSGLWRRGRETFVVTRHGITLRLHHDDNAAAEIAFDVLGLFIYHDDVPQTCLPSPSGTFPVPAPAP